MPKFCLVVMIHGLNFFFKIALFQDELQDAVLNSRLTDLAKRLEKDFMKKAVPFDCFFGLKMCSTR